MRHDLRQHDAELVEQPPEFVGLHDAGLHELRAQAVQRQHDLLGLGLDGNEAHAGLLARRPDRLRVGSIGLVESPRDSWRLIGLSQAATVVA